MSIQLILVVIVVAFLTLHAIKIDDKVVLTPKQIANDAKVEKEIQESKDLLEPWDKVKTLARLDTYRAKLEKSAPQCAANMKQCKKNIEKLYSKANARGYKVDLDAHGKQKVGTGLYNKGKEIQKEYSIFFEQSVKCWKAELAKKRAAKAAAKTAAAPHTASNTTVTHPATPNAHSATH